MNIYWLFILSCLVISKPPKMLMEYHADEAMTAAYLCLWHFRWRCSLSSSTNGVSTISASLMFQSTMVLRKNEFLKTGVCAFMCLHLS